MEKEYQIQVKTIISEFKRKGEVKLTNYLIECIEEVLNDSYKINNIESEKK